jgi:two-component system sensor histidine kinase CreC
MKIGLRILFGYFLILGLTAWLVLAVFVEEVKPGVRATLEDTLVDTAQLLAETVAGDMQAGHLQHAALVTRMQAYTLRKVDAKISNIHKKSLDYRVTITDARGIVVFDSRNQDVGKDYSRWNDVYLTLQGRYGARLRRSSSAAKRRSCAAAAICCWRRC